MSSTARATRRKMQRKLQRKLAGLDSKTREATCGLLEAETAKLTTENKLLEEGVKFDVVRDKMREDMEAAYDKRLLDMKA